MSKDHTTWQSAYQSPLATITIRIAVVATDADNLTKNLTEMLATRPGVETYDIEVNFPPKEREETGE